MDSYWNGRRIVYAVTPGVERQLVPDVQVKRQRAKRERKDPMPVLACNPRVIDGVHVIALQYAEHVQKGKALKRAMGWFTARPKPGKDGSIRKSSDKMAIAAWRNVRVMGKPSKGTAHMDALDLDLAMRREMRRQMLARVRIA